MKKINIDKQFGEILLTFKVDDITDAFRVKINPHFLNEYLIAYEMRRRKCKRLGIDVRKYDIMVAHLTAKLNSVPVYLYDEKNRKFLTP